jgi:hypothetical protein
MSRLNRFVQLGAILGLLVAAAPVVAASAATPSAGPVGPVAPVAINPDMTVPGPGSQWPDPQQCPLSRYDMGPLGPMGPWGPRGPLHDKPHAACVGGDPEVK